MCEKKKEECRCSFCGKTASSVSRLIMNSGGVVGICDECVELAHEIILDDCDDLQLVTEENGQNYHCVSCGVQKSMDQFMMAFAPDASDHVGVCMDCFEKKTKNMERLLEINKKGREKEPLTEEDQQIIDIAQSMKIFFGLPVEKQLKILEKMEHEKNK